MTVAGTYYRDDHVILYHGDCVELVPALGIKADAVVADPPYGITAHTWDVWPTGWPSVMAGAARSMWVFGTFKVLLAFGMAGQFTPWQVSDDVIWRKENATGQRTDRFRRAHETAVHWYHGPWETLYHEPPRESAVRTTRRTQHRATQDSGWFGHRSGGQWDDDGKRLALSVIDSPSMWKRNPLSPTEKPVRVLVPLIDYACPPGGVILDPFAGSGSAGEAARLTGRTAVLIEADEQQCEKIATRMQQDFLDPAPAEPEDTVAELATAEPLF